MKKILSILFPILIFLNSQGQTKIEKKIDLQDSSIIRTVNLTVKKGVLEINFSARGFLKEGELSFKLIDPEGRTEGRFSLDAIIDGVHKPSAGRFTHQVKLPLTGIWELEIKTSRATGDLSYTININ